MFTGIFPARLSRLQRMLPDRRLVPAQVCPGVGAVTFTALEYYDTDIGPYNEFAIGIGLNSERFAALPGYNLLRQYAQRYFDVFIYHLPVTTEIALRGGVDLYNFPKFLASIDFIDAEDAVRCEVAGDGELICALEARKVDVAREIGMKFFLHLYQDRQPQWTEFDINGIKANMSWGPRNVRLELGTEHAIARDLAGVLLARHPVLTMYVPRLQAILYGPEHLTVQLLVNSGRELGIRPRARTRTAKPAA